jgi:uncharacterized protein (DUF427 family)
MRVEPSQKRVRAFRRGEVVVDTSRPCLVWEHPYYPTYYVPATDIRVDLVPDGALRAFDGEPQPELDGLARIEWDAMDAWFEEDEEVFVHPRDPYKRVDVLQSGRHVTVAVEGTVVATSSRPVLLFETSLPVRTYVPLVDVRMDLLRPSPTRTRCPYKGEAEHWSVQLGDRLVEDIAWTYRTPLVEVAKIAGLVAFYDHRVDLTAQPPYS